MSAHFKPLDAQTRKTLETVAMMIDSWDAEIAAHCRAVAQDLARLTPHHSTPDPAEVELWYWAGRLHDVGKIAVAETLLNKPGALAPNERHLVRRHARIGANLLRRIEAPELVVQAAEFHHEWWNGNGYPRGLAGEAIPYVGRLLAVVDTFQAMTHRRAYRSAYTPSQTRLEIERLAGLQFDPAIVEAYFAQAALRAVEHVRGGVLQPPAALERR